MGNVASRLDGVVELVMRSLSQGLEERIQQETESVIWLCRHPHDDNLTSRNDAPSSTTEDKKNDNNNNNRLRDHFVRFYLPMENCIFYVQSERGPLSFDAAPHTLVVTIGRQLEVFPIWTKFIIQSLQKSSNSQLSF